MCQASQSMQSADSIDELASAADQLETGGGWDMEHEADISLKRLGIHNSGTAWQQAAATQPAAACHRPHAAGATATEAPASHRATKSMTELGNALSMHLLQACAWGPCPGVNGAEWR